MRCVHEVCGHLQPWPSTIRRGSAFGEGVYVLSCLTPSQDRPFKRRRLTHKQAPLVTKELSFPPNPDFCGIKCMKVFFCSNSNVLLWINWYKHPGLTHRNDLFWLVSCTCSFCLEPEGECHLFRTIFFNTFPVSLFHFFFSFIFMYFSFSILFVIFFFISTVSIFIFHFILSQQSQQIRCLPTITRLQCTWCIWQTMRWVMPIWNRHSACLLPSSWCVHEQCRCKFVMKWIPNEWWWITRWPFLLCRRRRLTICCGATVAFKMLIDVHVCMQSCPSAKQQMNLRTIECCFLPHRCVFVWCEQRR